MTQTRWRPSPASWPERSGAPRRSRRVGLRGWRGTIAFNRSPTISIATGFRTIEEYWRNSEPSQRVGTELVSRRDQRFAVGEVEPCAELRMAGVAKDVNSAGGHAALDKEHEAPRGRVALRHVGDDRRMA